MVIPVRFSYTYKKYPFSPKATKRSYQLGILTCGGMCFVYGIFWVMIVDAILVGIGISNDVAIIPSLISLIGMVVLRNRIRRNLDAKITQMAMADLMALQNTDPAAFAQYAAVFAQELARYQAAYRYQAPPQYQTPYSHQAPPQHRHQASTQYHAPQTPPASEPVQSAPKQGFDIQTEQPAPVPEKPAAVEVPVQPEVPAQQSDVIELPENLPEVSETAPVQPEPPAEQPAPVDKPTAPEKQFCGQCGTKLKSGSLFCHNCGSKL